MPNGFARLGAHGAHGGGHGFMVVSLALAGLALAAAGLSWLAGREARPSGVAAPAPVESSA